MNRKLPPNAGLILLAVWLIVTGLTTLVNLHVVGLGTIMAILAIASGVLLILQR